MRRKAEIHTWRGKQTTHPVVLTGYVIAIQDITAWFECDFDNTNISDEDVLCGAAAGKVIKVPLERIQFVEPLTTERDEEPGEPGVHEISLMGMKFIDGETHVADGNPYIHPDLRPKYDEHLDGLLEVVIETKGDLEYCIARVMGAFMHTREMRYHTLHECAYAAVHAGQEFKRRFLDPREDTALSKNGEAYIWPHTEVKDVT